MTHRAKWIDASPEEPVVDTAKRSLKARLSSVQHYLPLAAYNAHEDIENVHQLRVSTRRAQAALKMYWDLLPDWRASWMEEQLKRIRRATGDARDDDVFARRLGKEKENAATVRLLELVDAHRTRSQLPIVAVVEKLNQENRLDRKVEKLLKRVRLRGQHKKSGKKISFGDWAPLHFALIVDRFNQAANFDKSDLESLHQFRIAGKALRYAVELLAGAFESELRDDVYPTIEKLQEKLGKLNDHVSARTRVLKWIGETNSASPELAYLYELLEFEKTSIQESTDIFIQWWTGKRNAKLRNKFQQVLGELAT